MPFFRKYMTLLNMCRSCSQHRDYLQPHQHNLSHLTFPFLPFLRLMMHRRELVRGDEAKPTLRASLSHRLERKCGSDASHDYVERRAEVNWDGRVRICEPIFLSSVFGSRRQFPTTLRLVTCASVGR